MFRRHLTFKHDLDVHYERGPRGTFVDQLVLLSGEQLSDRVAMLRRRRAESINNKDRLLVPLYLPLEPTSGPESISGDSGCIRSVSATVSRVLPVDYRSGPESV